MIRPVYKNNDVKEDVNLKSFMLGDKKVWRITVSMITSWSISKLCQKWLFIYSIHISVMKLRTIHWQNRSDHRNSFMLTYNTIFGLLLLYYKKIFVKYLTLSKFITSSDFHISDRKSVLSLTSRQSHQFRVTRRSVQRGFTHPSLI